LGIPIILNNKFSRSVVFPYGQEGIYSEKVLDANFKGAVFSSDDILNYLNMLHFPEKHYNSCEEKIFIFSLCILLNENTALLTEINQQLLAITTNGFMQAWTKTFTGSKITDSKIPQEGPKRLSNNQLQGLYEVFLVGLTGSFFVFTLELLSRKLKVLRDFLDFVCRS
jgi:hypothetical protein